MTLPNQSMKSWRSVILLAPCILAISLLSVPIAEADQNFAGFRHIDTSGEPPEATQAAPDWGPVQTDKASIANFPPFFYPSLTTDLYSDCPGPLPATFGKIRN